MSSALASSPRRIHVVPLPESRPPVVPPDEVFARRESEFVQDSLALDFLARDELFAHQLSARAELPDPAPLVAALAQAFVEVMAGLRPPPQVSRWTSPEVYAALCRRPQSPLAGARPLGDPPWCVAYGSKSLLTESSRRVPSSSNKTGSAL